MQVLENKSDTSMGYMHVPATLGMHQPEVHFCPFEKLFLIFPSKYQSLGGILLFILARAQSPRQIQVHKQSSHQCKIYTIVSQCFCITLWESELKKVKLCVIQTSAESSVFDIE